MTTIDTIIEDLTSHTITEERLKGIDLRLQAQFETDKFIEAMDSQYSFTCVDEKTKNWRHYELMSDKDLEDYTCIAMCLFNDGMQINTVIVGYYRNQWVPVLTYVSELKMYDTLLFIQSNLIDRSMDWLTNEREDSEDSEELDIEENEDEDTE